MRALIISSGQDTGGQNIRWKRAADHQPSVGLHVRAVSASRTYIQYPTDISMAGNGGAIRRLWRDVDVIHLNNRPHAYDRYDRGRRKPALLHHHGSAFRTDPAPLLKRAARERWPQAVSTLDLADIAPDVLHWLPTAYNLDELALIRGRHRRADDGTVRVAHAPTSRSWKSTEAFLAAVEQLQSEGLPIELELIEQSSWAECLARKAAADVFFDQVKLGYGCNAIEAWGMGIPVIAGAAPATLERMGREFDGRIPFFTATEESIADALRQLVLSADLRAEYAVRGMEHAARFHAELPALERLSALYQLAIAHDTTRSARNIEVDDIAEAVA